MKLTKIVITGGPSAGKTTAMSWVQNAFSKLGYTVLFVPETATELSMTQWRGWPFQASISLSSITTAWLTDS